MAMTPGTSWVDAMACGHLPKEPVQERATLTVCLSWRMRPDRTVGGYWLEPQGASHLVIITVLQKGELGLGTGQSLPPKTKVPDARSLKPWEMSS